MAESSERSSRWSGSTGVGGVAPVEIYQPPVFCKCKCKKKAARWISWSLDNPGRRYYRCIDKNLEEDRGFFEWLDPPTSKWIKDLLLDLKDTVFRLKRERGEAVVDEVRE
ncbi:hypothetical protein SORBI_3006G015750 [Sorghum bicolor]|uniref:GRF-type domain-containing protein n=1 Tax=Sorghum bicolor TaxID=4558 RepID=A0A1Z5RCN0_SORBI|nr:hypothetical protein SORBI_3006G015750 [Sorghum bicolor]